MNALALFSGGLDSMLATKIIADMGINVTALHIDIGFGNKKNINETLQKRALQAGASFLSIDAREEYIQKILFDPLYGYGKNFNPCIDCHGYMFRIAKAMMDEFDASFIVTGEVLGQRPMSQRGKAMKLVNKLANDTEEKLILRPLSAKLMARTTPEINGWVDREKLFGISGRSRDIQIKLAKQYNWEDYESPGGGCLLTDIHYSQRIREHIAHDNFSVEDIELLKFGRHFRLTDGAKLIVGRSQEDNASLKKIKSDKYVSFNTPIFGPLALLSKNASPQDKALAAKIVITYTKSTQGEIYDICIDDEIYKVSPFESKNSLQKYFFDSKLS